MDNINFENKEYIAELVEEKIALLKDNEEFNKKHKKLSNLLDKFETGLNDKQKEQLNEITQMVFNIEEYYFVLAYSLGLKYGDELKKI